MRLSRFDEVQTRALVAEVVDADDGELTRIAVFVHGESVVRELDPTMFH